MKWYNKSLFTTHRDNTPQGRLVYGFVAVALFAMFAAFAAGVAQTLFG